MFDHNLSKVKKNEKKEFVQSIVSFEDDEEDLQQLNLPSAKPNQNKELAYAMNSTITGNPDNNNYMVKPFDTKTELPSNVNNVKSFENQQNNFPYNQYSAQSPQKYEMNPLNGSKIQESPEPLLNGKTPEYQTKMHSDASNSVIKSHDIVKRVNFNLSTPEQANENDHRNSGNNIDHTVPEAKLSEIQIHKKAQGKFFYYALPLQHVSLFLDLPPYGQRMRYFINILLPKTIIIIILLVIWAIQINFGDYCGISICKCDNYGARIWVFFKQLFLFKFGLIFSKNIIFRKDFQCSPKEEVIYWFITVAIDFIITVFGSYTQDWIFAVWNMGFSVFVGSLFYVSKKNKLPGFPGFIYEIRNLFLYDMFYISVYLLLSIVFPKAQKQLIFDYSDFDTGGSFYLLLYVLLLDNGLNWLSDSFTDLSHAGYYFFARLTQAIILGSQWGVFFSYSQSGWGYWVTLFLLLLRKVNSMTSYLYIMIMKFLYLNTPPAVKHYFTVSEVSLLRRYRHGLIFENLFLLLVFYIIYGNNHNYIAYLFEKEYYVIDDCSFKSKLQVVKDYQPFYIYVLFLASELISLFINQVLRYDLIKYPLDFQFNLLEKTFVELTTVYFFYYAFFINQVNLWRMQYPVF